MTPRFRLGSFRQQIVVLTACVTAFAVVLLTVLLQFALADLSRGDVDRVLEERTDAVISSIDSATSGPELVVPDSDLDAGIVVYDSSGRAVAGVAAPSMKTQYDALATTRTDRLIDIGDISRLRATSFTTSSGADGVVVVVERLAPYEEAERYALLASLATGLLAIVLTAGIAAWVTGRALTPVARMADTAADWSEHHLSRRFGLGPPTDEITSLAATLDTLLDKVAAAIQSEQRLTSELAHELRTPLTTVQGTAELALLRHDLPVNVREDLEQITAGARRMAASITTLLEAARGAVGTGPTVSCSLEAVVTEVVGAQPPGSMVQITATPSDRLVAVPHALAVRILTPVVENALRHAHTHVQVSADAPATGPLTIAVEDDGPGVAAGSGDIFEPGVTSGDGSGAGLGLSICRRLARSAGGDVELARAQGPTRFVVRLPQA